MDTSNFQYNRDSLFSRNVPPSLPKFVGRPEVVLFWDAEKPNQKSYIDVKVLVQKASAIFKQHSENIYVRDSTLKRLSMGLKESEKKNLDGFESLSTINQTVVSDTWQYYFLTVARWLMHFEEFQKIDDTVKLKILETIWHIWATLDRHCATASYRRSHPNAPKTQIISRRGVLLDLTKVQFDSTWLSDYPPSEIAYFLRQNSSDHFDIIGALLELEPSDMEMTFMLAQLSFEYAGKRCQGEILKLTEHFQKLLANDLHNYYVKEMKMPKYSNRLSKMMKINNSIQKNLWEHRPRMEVAKIFNIIKIEFSHPEIFALSLCSKKDHDLNTKCPIFLERLEIFLEYLDTRKKIPHSKGINLRIQETPESNFRFVSSLEPSEIVRIFNNIHLKINELRIQSPSAQFDKLTNLINSFAEIGGNFKIRANRLFWRCSSENSDGEGAELFIKLLSLIDENCLQMVHNDMDSFSEDQFEWLGKFCKNVKTLNLEDAMAKSVDPLLNAENVVVLFEKLDAEHIWKMIQSFISRDLPIGSSFYFHSEHPPKLVDVFKMHNVRPNNQPIIPE
ncbi:hypothetical protein B9Z55_018128 [Caenorhabditis nigoni]|uniref:NR LBD domain-containing protein n=1 Tax=Caenorhabditis nigoni TaxID=1611254 RepID=A0A2G5TCE5_9PELO|nr:hypothetical protein B9Z55_018128 [Caenorhabditis nigoni]